MSLNAESPVPFFIVGAQRSGTTMLRLMLNRHPKIGVPFESDFLSVYNNLPGDGDLGDRRNVEKALDALAEEPLTKRGGVIEDPQAILAHSIDGFSALIDAVFSEYARTRGKLRWGVKSPHYVGELNRLWHLFPGCRFVHLVRDGRDVALSLRRVSWGSKHIPRVAEDWRWKVTLGRKMGEMIRGHYLEVRYEDLVRNPGCVLRVICEFLGESYDEAMLSYPVAGEREMPADSMKWHRNSVSPPDETKISSWKEKMSLSDQILFDEIAGPALELFGYESVNHPATLSSRLKSVYYYTIERW